MILLSNNRMFRIIQGDVGSGKTIVSLLAIINVIRKWLSMCFDGSY